MADTDLINPEGVEHKVCQWPISLSSIYEHRSLQVFSFGNVMFLVVELKVAQVEKCMANSVLNYYVRLKYPGPSMLRGTPAVASVNQKAGIGNLRVYGLITNLSVFEFYSYDPTGKQVFFDSAIIANNKRDDFTSDMIESSGLSAEL